MLKAILFDMDGVLVDSEILHCNAGVKCLNQLGVPVTFDECFQFVGTTTNKMMEQLIDRYSLRYTKEYLLDEYMKTKKEFLDKVGYDPIPYTKELIISLYEEGYKLAIASSSGMKDILYVTEMFGIRSYFHKIISGSELKHPKPAPDIYLLAAKELGVRPNECIVIEDSHHGVTAGKSANMPVVGFLNPNSGNQDLSRADILIEGFEEIDDTFLNHVYCRYHKEPIIIGVTKNLTIREFTLSDLPSLYAMLKEQPYYKESAPESIICLTKEDLSSYDVFYEKYSSYINTIYPYYGYGLWGVFLSESKECIGRCGIHSILMNDLPIYELGYEIDIKYQRNGYAYEACNFILSYAFSSLYMDKIVARIHHDNLNSISLAEKLGMKEERHFQEELSNIILYSINKLTD